MNTTSFTILYISLLCLEFLTLYTLTVLNIGSVLKNRDSIPNMFKDKITNQNYSESIKYTLKKEHFSIFRLVFSTLLTLVILFSGLLGSLESVLMNFITNKTILGLVYIGIISSLISLTDLPLSLYSTFVIEEEFGFNKMTIKSYISDMFKQSILSIVLGGLLLSGLFLFMDKSGSIWWILASSFFILFQLILVIIYPIFIAPLFNKFKPLDNGELKSNLEEMAIKAKFSIKGIYIMDGSKRSGHSNAYFTGIGSNKRIVLYDTLVEKLTIPELCGVLAHEIGHWKKGHITKRLLLTFLSVPVAFFILSLILNYPVLYNTFKMEVGSYHGLIVLIMLISGTFTFMFSPLSNIMSRKHEFEADNFAKELQGDCTPLIEALFKLSNENLSNLTPDKYYSAFHYSHPPIIERVNRLKGLKGLKS